MSIARTIEIGKKKIVRKAILFISFLWSYQPVDYLSSFNILIISILVLMFVTLMQDHPNTHPMNTRSVCLAVELGCKFSSSYSGARSKAMSP